jgi:6-phosphogluconolactonase
VGRKVQELLYLVDSAGAENNAAAVIFLVNGAEKAKVLREVLEGDHQPERLPAQLIRPNKGNLLWLVDQEAAGFLSKRKKG